MKLKIPPVDTADAGRSVHAVLVYVEDGRGDIARPSGGGGQHLEVGTLRFCSLNHLLIAIHLLLRRDGPLEHVDLVLLDVGGVEVALERLRQRHDDALALVKVALAAVNIRLLAQIRSVNTDTSNNTHARLQVFICAN